MILDNLSTVFKMPLLSISVLGSGSVNFRKIPSYFALTDSIDTTSPYAMNSVQQILSFLLKIFKNASTLLE